MVVFIAEIGELTVPEWVIDIDAYRRWVDDADFPEEGRIWWLRGKVWADMSREQIFTHLAIKNEIYFVLTGVVKRGVPGLFLPDGLLLSNFAADISGKPDGTFVSQASLASDRIRLIEGKEGGYVELQGSPDMVLEVVSKSSARKDSIDMKQAYWEAGIREYWLVDARRELKFDIFRRGARGYAATPKRDGWLKSAVFGKSFRLTAATNKQGHPEYTLHVK